MRRKVVNMVSCIPFFGANRDGDAQLHASDSCIPMAPILYHKISSPLVPAWGKISDKKKKHKNTNKAKRNRHPEVHLKRIGVLHHPPGSNCLVCSLPHTVTLGCCRIFGGLASFSRPAFCGEVVVVLALSTPTSA